MVQNDSLPSLQKMKLQKRIVVLLGENGPKTKNAASITLNSSYKPVLFGFNSLIEKGLIQAIDTKERRGRNFEMFWLTQRGVVLSLIYGAASAYVQFEPYCNTKK